jgi:hypothetical protein
VKPHGTATDCGTVRIVGFKVPPNTEPITLGTRRSKSLDCLALDYPSFISSNDFYVEYEQKANPLLFVEWVGVLLRFVDAPSPVNVAGAGAATVTNGPRFAASSGGLSTLLQSQGNRSGSA